MVVKHVMREKAMSDYYFAQDGNWGSAEEILLVDTTNWTEEDWQLIDDATDSERGQIAQRLSEERD